MEGSIRFNPDINIEVSVDPTAAEGERLLSAKNLVDGQELGTGGADLPEVTPADEGKVLAVDDEGEWVAERKAVYFSTPADNISYNIAKDYLTKGIMVVCGNINDNPSKIAALTGIGYNSDTELYEVEFGDGILVASDADDDQMEWD